MRAFIRKTVPLQTRHRIYKVINLIKRVLITLLPVAIAWVAVAAISHFMFNYPLNTVTVIKSLIWSFAIIGVMRIWLLETVILDMADALEKVAERRLY